MDAAFLMVAVAGGAGAGLADSAEGGTRAAAFGGAPECRFFGRWFLDLLRLMLVVLGRSGASCVFSHRPDRDCGRRF